MSSLRVLLMPSPSAPPLKLLALAPELRTVARWWHLADVGEQYSRGFGHITTRQNVQFHFVKLHDVEPAMRRLADAGLTTREACGSSVRNITACPYAGVAADERFDVTPYAEALTRYLLRHPLSSTLPRKFKIAFEGCATDHVATGINDLGFRAVVGPDGGRGFRVTAGGGTARSMPKIRIHSRWRTGQCRDPCATRLASSIFHRRLRSHHGRSVG
jgi:sulfite reductase beta subunit-like hemoprotein